MRWPRWLLCAVLVLTAFLVQTVILSRLPLPGAEPDLVLVVTVALGLAYGPQSGAVIGFLAGLFVDVAPPADHTLGRAALALCLVGYLSGLFATEVTRSAFVPVFAVAVASVVGTAVFAGVGAIIGDLRIGWSAAAEVLPAVVLYDVVLAPFVVPAILVLARRIEPRPLRR
jgi:rod shape-determining protein MreD